jgi:drug/metabolite transporter (DMT)-like permease
MTKTVAAPSVLRGLLVSLLGYAVFSSHDALVKVLADYSVFQIIFFAMLFGYVPFSLARITDAREISLRPVNPWLVFFRALMMVGSLCFAFLAFSMLPMVQVYVLLFTTPVLISLLAIPFLGERIQLFRGSLIIMGLVGVIVVLRPTPQSLELGHLFGAMAACCGAGAAVISRKIGRVESSATLILTPLILNILVSGSLLYFVYKPMPLVDLSLMFLLGVLALLGQLAVLTGYRCAPAAVVAPMQYSQLIWAIVFGALFFNEPVDTLTLVGAGITILSGVLMVWRESRVSVNQPVLRSRNMRGVGSAPVPGYESDH